MKEITFFDLVEVLKENRDKLKFRKRYCSYKKRMVNAVKIFKDEKVIAKIYISILKKETFDLNKFIDEFLNKKNFENIYFVVFNFSSDDIIKVVDGRFYLVKFFDRIFKISEKRVFETRKKFGGIFGGIFKLEIEITFFADEIHKNKPMFFEVDDFETVKELL